jgi:predicted membrane protein DUF2157
MENQSDLLTQQLVEKGFISEAQHTEIKEYRSKGIFSLNSELLFLLYLSVLLFTTGVGTFVYKNIDSIGHLAILAVNFILMVACFYFSFKKAKGFSREEVFFENPLYDYLVLTGSILCCIFIGYLQFQYEVFGSDLSLVSLFTSVLCFGIAYYFDNRSVLSMAITALATFIGITLTPKTLFENEIYSNPLLSYYGLALGILILLWTFYTTRENLKKHFHFVYLTFAQHLISICCIAGLATDNWLLFVPFSAAAGYYFYKTSYKENATSLFVFSLIYAYIDFNILLFKFIDYIDSYHIVDMLFIFSPFYVIGSIFLFIRFVRNFNKVKHDSLR